jgi:hypothetical protein
MASEQAQRMVSYTLDISHLRELLIEFVREHATLEDLLQIAMITTPEVVDVIQEERNNG